MVINLKLTEKNPERAIFSSDSRWLYVSAQKDDVVDTKTLKQVTSIKIGSLPRGLGCLPDASRAYVAGEEAKTVYSIDASIQSVLRTI